MTKAIHSILLIAYLVSLSIALPSAPRQPELPQSNNEPLTLLGKPYRRLWKSSQPNLPSRFTLVLPFIDSSDHPPPTTTTNTSPDRSLIEPSREDAHAVTFMHTFHQLSPPRQVPVVVNASPPHRDESRGFGISLDLAGFGTERLRLGLGLGRGRSRGPLRYTPSLSPSPEEVLRSDQKNIVIPGASGKCHHDHLSRSEQSPADAAAIEPEVEVESRSLSPPRKPSKRLYDRGEWKSRLSEDY